MAATKEQLMQELCDLLGPEAARAYLQALEKSSAHNAEASRKIKDQLIVPTDELFAQASM